MLCRISIEKSVGFRFVGGGPHSYLHPHQIQGHFLPPLRQVGHFVEEHCRFLPSQPYMQHCAKLRMLKTLFLPFRGQLACGSAQEIASFFTIPILHSTNRLVDLWVRL